MKKKKSKKYFLVLDIMGFSLPSHNYEMQYVATKLKSDSEVSSWVLHVSKKPLLNIVF